MKSGYDQFFKEVKKNSAAQPNEKLRPQPVKLNTVKSTAHKKDKKSKKGFPVVSFMSFIIFVGGLFLVVEKYDHIENYLSKIEVGLGTAQAEVKTVENKVTEVATAPVATVKTDETDYLFKLADRKKELDAREEDLNKKTAEVAKQKLEIEEKLKQLEDYRAQITNLLRERITTDSAKVETLVQVYSNMKPSQAAKVFETLDEDLVIEILGKMKKKNAADILNLVKTDKAQILSERYAGYRSPASAVKENTNIEESKP